MTDPHDPLEHELRALPPPPVSPELRGKIAARLGGAARIRWPWTGRGLVVAAAIAAAVLVAVLAARPRRATEPIQADAEPRDRARLTSAIPVEDELPTLQAYTRALAGSHELLNALLDQHAGLGVQPNATDARCFAFARSVDGLHPLIGDL